jgi:D-glycero-alpha-D-manno-heptose 1-phosphate guanylyltransferase
MSQTAIILAGGLGTRLRHMVPDVPKSMAPVNGRPFLEYLLDYLNKYSISNVILSVGFLNDKIISYFGNEYHGLSIQYSIEKEPLGTGGAIVMAAGLTAADTLLVLNGDTLFNVDLEMLSIEHAASQADITLALRMVPDAGRYGSIELDESGRIQHFSEKKPGSGQGIINGGIYLIRKRLFDKMDLPSAFSIERDFFPGFCKTGFLQGYVGDGYFLDIGIPADYEKAQIEFRNFLPTGN